METVTIDAARNGVYRHFLDNAPTHMVFDGVSLAPLDGENPGRLSLALEVAAEPEDTAPWYRLVLRHLGREQETLGPPGARRFRNDAMIFFSAFVPLAELEGPSDEGDKIAEAVKAIFSSQRIALTGGGSIQTYASVPREHPPEGPWFHMLVETPMSYDEKA